MSDVKVIASGPNGLKDITEGVRCMYDLLVQSMDWGSGFLSIEEAEHVVEIAQTCNFVPHEDAVHMMSAYWRSVNARSPWTDNPYRTDTEKLSWRLWITTLDVQVAYDNNSVVDFEKARKHFGAHTMTESEFRERLATFNRETG